MQLNTFTRFLPDLNPQWQAEPGSLYRCLEGIKDPRKAKGKRYPLAFVLTLIILAKLAGADTISGVVSFCGYRRTWLAQQLHWPRRFPSHSTYTNVLQGVDGDEVVRQVAQAFLRARAEQAKGEQISQIAVDGKTMRGTQEHADHAKVHVLSWYECQSGLVLGQQVVADKENEIVAAKAFLTSRLVKNRLISADAMHTQKDWCTEIHRLGGYVLLFAKANQPTLQADLADYFEDPDLDPRQVRRAECKGKEHGRIETRRILTSEEMNDWFADQWTGFAQAFRLTRRVVEDAKVRQEVVYGFTSLSAQQASAEFLLQAARRHWAIENRLHYRKDVTLREDASQVRATGAPQALSALNSLVLGLMDFLQVKNVAEQRRAFNACPQDALDLLLRPLSG